jgi:hypothetical protein
MRALNAAINAQFYSMIRTPVKKDRMCLKCGCTFKSDNNGHRICSSCVESNKKYGAKVQHVSMG